MEIVKLVLMNLLLLMKKVNIDKNNNNNKFIFDCEKCLHEYESSLNHEYINYSMR